ncbi:hypothetical protein [Sphingomonas sp.]|uniref:hypothetical protein n=1 Tax=Sphingomonas sp. TaxID=28214 RepID=UPI003B00FA2B
MGLPLQDRLVGLEAIQLGEALVDGRALLVRQQAIRAAGRSDDRRRGRAELGLALAQLVQVHARPSSCWPRAEALGAVKAVCLSAMAKVAAVPD